MAKLPSLLTLFPRLRRQAPRDQVAADAGSLIAAHGDSAYDVARTREDVGKVIDGNRARPLGQGAA
jgi:hypothetical protein